MRIAIAALLAVLVSLPLLFVPLGPASADVLDKALNTGSNLVIGWTNCPKAYVNEVMKGKQNIARGVVGAVATGPGMCGVNTAATYVGVVGDVLTLPFSEKNLLPPAAHKSFLPPIRLPF